MATFTQATYAVDNITSQPDQVKGDATALKQAFDQTGSDTKDFINNTLIQELESTTAGASGADRLGFQSATVVGGTIKEAIEDNRAAIIDQTLGEIPDNSLTEAKMAAEMKKQAGGVAEYDTVATNTTNIATNASDIADLQIEVETIEDIRVSTDTAGSSNAYTLTLGNDFDFTLDGNVVRINPNFTNTGSSTISINGTTKNIRKFDIDTDAYVVLEEEDIKKKNPTELRFDVSEDFFVLAPKTGAVIKAVQHGSFTMSGTSSNVTITSVDSANSKVVVSWYSDGDITGPGDWLIYPELTSDTNLNISRGSSAGGALYVSWQVIEYNSANIKSFQKIEGSITTSLSTDVTIDSVDVNKTEIVAYFKTTYTGGASPTNNELNYELTSSTNVNISTDQPDGTKNYIIYIVEHK